MKSIPRLCAALAILTAMASAGRAQSCASICLMPSTLPSATVNTPYSTSLRDNTVGGTPPYTYSSAVLPGGLTADAAGNITGTPTTPTSGTFSGSITITDSSMPPVNKEVALFIQVFPQPLTITTPTLPLGIQGAAYSQTVHVTGGVPPYSFSLFRSSLTGTGLGLDASTGIVSGTPAAAGSISFKVEVTDSEQQQSQAFQAFTLQINPPLAIATAPALHFALVGQAYSLQLATQPGTGGPNVSWSAAANTLPGGLTLDATGLLHGTPTAAGSFAFALHATDGIVPTVLNATMVIYAPIVITTAPLPGGIYQQAYGPTALTATGGSGTFVWSATGLPAGLGVSGNAIQGTPTVTGHFNAVTLSVTDSVSGQNASQPSYSVTIAYPPLSITVAPPSVDVAVGGGVSVNFSVTGGNGPYKWTPVGTLPQGYSLTLGGALTGTASQAGNFSIGVEVTDSQPISLSTSVGINVLGLSPSPLPPGTTVSTYSAGISATGGTPPYTYSASGLPAGLSLSSSGGLTGQVRQPGTYGFSVQVTDGSGVSVTGSYSVTINVPNPLTVASPALANGTVNIPYSGSVNSAATGGNPPYQWSMQAGALPPGVSLSATGGLSGTPNTNGAYSFTVQATDGSGATASAGATIEIDAAPLKITTQSPLTSGIVGSDYPQQILSATGGVGTHTFSVTSGSLPDGLGLNNGVISGKPTTAGDFSFTVTAQDSAGTKATAPLGIHVRAASTDLIVAAGSLSFSLQTGATTLPPSQGVSISSSNVSQTLDFSVQVSAGAGWLAVSGGSSTPTSLSVGLNSAALALTSDSSPYSATITVTCTSSNCASTTPQVINVSLAVTTAPAVLNVTTGLLSFSVTSTSGGASSQPIFIQNSGGGSLGFARISCEASWCQASGAPASLNGGATGSVTVTADPTGLTAGYYRTTVDIVSSAGSASVAVTMLIAAASQMLLAPAGVQFEMAQGGAPGNPSGSFLVSVAGTSTIGYSAAVLSNPSWLTLNSSGGSASSSAPGMVSFSINSAAAALTAQAYYATIEVTAPDAVNSVLDFQVVLNVTPANTPQTLVPQPAGLVFLAEAGSVPAPQTVQILSSSSAVGYQASASTNSGGSWLSVTPTTGGTTSSSAPGQSEVSVDTSSLAPGVYYGGASYSLANPPVQTVNVTLIVEPHVTAPAAVHGAGLPHGNATGAGCSASALAPAPTGLVNNFSAPASWPTPLSIMLLDNCGNAVAGGQIVVTFTNGDPPLALGLANSTTGLYSGTWTPRNAGAQVSLNARASASGFAPAAVQLTGSVVPNVAPVLNAHGTLHVFNPQVGAAMAPGTIVQIYGSGLASGIASAQSIPLPTSLNGTSVIIGGIPAPLYFVSPGQVNAQIPFGLNPSSQYQVIANANGALTAPNSIQLAPVTPGFAAFATGGLIAQHWSDGSLITQTAPAKPGEIVVAYLAGMGDTTVPVDTGGPSPSSPLAYATVAPVLTLNGVNAPILFAGMTPGLVGLYQIDFQVPADAPDGTLTVVLTQNGFGSNTTTLPVQH